MLNVSLDRESAPMNRIRIHDKVEAVPPAKPQPKRILVVDDLPEVVAMFKEASRRLRGLSVEMTTEVNSQRALELVKTHPFDLVVSDFRMSQVDGIELLTAARAADPRGYRILMTGYNEIPAGIDRIREANVDAYVQKPIRGAELVLLLTDFLQAKDVAIQEHRAAARELEEDAARD